ncbi:cytochrome b N-terminal domain-containing protein [Cupriavidus basilensis]
MLYGSYRKPRELVWIFGCLIFLCLMAEAFMGYLLPWGQMSYWGAQVIVNLFSAIPVIGQDLSLFIRGDYVVSDATLNRFFSFHVIAVPLVLAGAGGRAHHRAARSGFQQPGRRRDQGQEGRKRYPAGWHSVPPVLLGPRHAGCGRLPDDLLGRDLLLPGSGRLFPGSQQLLPG